MATIGPLPTNLVLTDAQRTVLDRLKSVASAGNTVGARTPTQALDAIKINGPALQLAAGSAEATGDLQGARYVARKTKDLADGLRAALKDASSAQAVPADQLQTYAKQLKLFLVKARIALVSPFAAQSGTQAQQRAELDVRAGEAALKALDAQLKSSAGIDIKT
jgi:hypothetical protein